MDRNQPQPPLKLKWKILAAAGGLLAAGASMFVVDADMGTVNDGGLLAGKEYVQILPPTEKTLLTEIYTQKRVVAVLPLEKDEVAPPEKMHIYFNATNQEHIPPGLYQVTTRMRLYEFMGRGPASIVKADPLI
jgi:hypothetical protein